MIENHINLEKKTVEIAEQSIGSLKGQQGMIVQQYLLNYLLEDERKHNDLLKNLEDIKKGIYRSV
jgi:bacterioferritin (cytochrome b1)